MDQDAEEMRDVVQVRHPVFEPWTVFERDSVLPGRNGCPGVDLFLAGAGTAARSIGAGCREFPYGVLNGVTEKFAVYAKVTDGVGRTFEFSYEC